MPSKEIEEFERVFPIVLKRVLPLGVIALIVAFILINIFIPTPKKVSALVIAIFGISIFFGVYAKRYAEKLLNKRKFEE